MFQVRNGNVQDPREEIALQASFLRETGLDFLGDVPWGGHFCQFYHRMDDLLESVIPFLQAGLKNNEYCIWVLMKEDYLPQARKALSDRIADFEGRLKKGQLELLTAEEWYGKIKPAELVGQWSRKIRSALRDNRFSGVRVVGGVHKLGQGRWKPFLDYEERVHKEIGKWPVIALCTYSLANCPLTYIPKVIDRHHKTFLKKGWIWEVVDGTNVA